MNIRQWLSQLDLEEYADSFEENEITVEDLSELTSDDLKNELGVTKLIHRKKMLAAIFGEQESSNQAAGSAETPSPATIAYPEGLRPDQMPTFLAHPWRSLCLEDHPRVKLHWLTDTAELAVRWAVTVALAEVLHAHDSILPKSLASRLRDNIQRPTLGRWLGVLRDLTEGKPQHPQIAPGAFDLYAKTFEPRFMTAHQGGTMENSLLVMRNQIAHGGGMSRQHASELLEVHIPMIEALLREVLEATAGADSYAVDKDKVRRLVGLSPPLIDKPKLLRDAREGTWLMNPDHALPMLPLVMYGPVKVLTANGELEAKPNSETAQVYTRAEADRLSYTPLGRDEAHSEILEVELFRAIFRMDDSQAERKAALGDLKLPWDEALNEARNSAADLVGRDAEIKQLKAWLKAKDVYKEDQPRIGWLWGGPGFGKSIIMAKLAADYSSSNNRGLFFHRFRGGNPRTNKRNFLRFLLAALHSWEPLAKITDEPNFLAEGDELIDTLEAKLKAISQLEAPNPRAPKPCFWIMVDGFDEIVGADPKMIDLVRKFAVPGTLWLLCGRAEHGLNEELNNPSQNSELVFEQGLPEMSPDDIRAMLLEGLGNARYALLKRDSDTADGEGVQNEFVERVVRNARGLPLYVHLLLDDLRTGNLTVNDESRLPDGLTAYYDALMDRVGLSSVKRDLPLLVCALALVTEPLDAEALALLSSPELDDFDDYLPRIQAALRVGQALLRRTFTPDGTEGYALYHQSFQEYVTGRAAHGGLPAVEPAPALADTLREAQRKLYRLVSRWDEMPEGNLRNHLFRWGSDYCLRWQKDKAVEGIQDRLEDYRYVHTRTASLPSSAVIDLVEEYGDLLPKVPAPKRDLLHIWEAFLRERAHILGRGERVWPAERILLQLAVEHADESPITAAAMAWLERDECDWVWMRKVRRPEHIKPNLCLRVFEGHRDRVQGALRLEDGRFLTWSKDHQLKLWSEVGEELEVLEGHTDSVDGALLIDATKAASWSRSGSIMIWDLKLNEPIHSLEGHTKEVLGATMLDDGRLLSWSKDKTLRCWDLDSGKQTDELKGHTRALRGAEVLDDGKVLSWSEDRSIRLWSLESHECLATLKGDKTEGHEREVTGALRTGDHILSWGMDGNLVLWDLEAQTPLFRMEGHEGFVTGAMLLDQERILSWAKDNTLKLWHMSDGHEIATLVGHTRGVTGAMLLEDGRLLSWSEDANLRIWDLNTGKCLHMLEGHASLIYGAQRLKSGKLLSWSGGGNLRIWDLDTAECLAILEGHTAGVWGALELADGKILSWSWDHTMRLWEWSAGGEVEEVVGHRGWIQGVERLDNGQVLSYSADGDIFLWDVETSQPIVHYKGHDKSVGGVEVLATDDELISWAGDQTVRIWELSTGVCKAVCEGHEKTMQGATALDQDHIASWSSDATIRIWNRKDGTLLHTFDDHKKLISWVTAWDDKRLVSWSSDGTIRIFDWKARTLLHTLDEHNGKTIKGARRVLDGKLLSWASDNTLKLWDIDEAKLLHSFEGHTKIVERARMLNERLVASFAKDNTIRIWDLEARALVVALKGDDEMSDGAILVDEDRVATWARKPKRFLEWSLKDGALLGSVGYDEALRERPELWRKRYEASRSPNLMGDFRLHSTEGGVELYIDHDEDERGKPIVCWRETGFWMADVLSEGTPTVHAGPYLHQLHMYRGKDRIKLNV